MKTSAQDSPLLSASDVALWSSKYHNLNSKSVETILGVVKLGNTNSGELAVLPAMV